MITQEYIDTTPAVQSLIAKLAQIPGVVSASAGIVTDPLILEKAHPESIMFYVNVPRYTGPVFAGSTVNLLDVSPQDYQKLGFSMPPSAYLFETEGHPAIVHAMTAYIRDYTMTGVVRTSTGASVPIA